MVLLPAAAAAQRVAGSKWGLAAALPASEEARSLLPWNSSTHPRCPHVLPAALEKARLEVLLQHAREQNDAELATG